MGLEIDKNRIVLMLFQTRGDGRGPDFTKREIDIFTSTSYRDEQYRVWMFHVQGSPDKALGFIRRTNGGYKMTVSIRGEKTKTFYFGRDFLRTTYANLINNPIGGAHEHQAQVQI